MRRAILVVLVLLAPATSARAQLVVVDPGNLAQTIMIAERTLREYETLLTQYQTIVRMSQGLGPLDRYRIPTIGITGHDPEAAGNGSGLQPTSVKRGRLFHSGAVRCRLQSRFSESVAPCCTGRTLLSDDPFRVQCFKILSSPSDLTTASRRLALGHGFESPMGSLPLPSWGVGRAAGGVEDGDGLATYIGANRPALHVLL